MIYHQKKEAICAALSKREDAQSEAIQSFVSRINAPLEKGTSFVKVNPEALDSLYINNLIL